MKAQHKHDYRGDRSKDGVALVVRQGNKYGGALAGEEVLVDECELRNPSTMAACAPHDVLAKAAAEREAAAAKLAAEVKKASVQSAIDAGLAQMLESVETAKARGDAESKLAADLAADRAAQAATNKLPDVFAQADEAILPGGLKRAAKPSKGRGR
jgi:hypothetical protein